MIIIINNNSWVRSRGGNSLTVNFVTTFFGIPELILEGCNKYFIFIMYEVTSFLNLFVSHVLGLPELILEGCNNYALCIMYEIISFLNLL